MIQTNTSVTIFNGLNLLIEAKHIRRPRGNASISVNKNSKHVSPKPSNKYFVTSIKSIINFEKNNL